MKKVKSRVINFIVIAAFVIASVITTLVIIIKSIIEFIAKQVL